MLGPIQHTSLPLDPIRQQITPPAPTLPPQPVIAAGQQPVPPSGSSKDQFEHRQEGQTEDAAEREARRQQQRQEALRAYHNVWARLHALQKLAREGDGPQAREAAVEAAALALSIRDLANGLPAISAIDRPAALESARSGVGAAMGVIDIANAYPAHPVEDRIVINGARHQVIEAMAGVEAVAVDFLTPMGGSILPTHFDVKT
jgi:hypothetical protein